MLDCVFCVVNGECFMYDIYVVIVGVGFGGLVFV